MDLKICCARDGEELGFEMTVDNGQGQIVEYYGCPVCDTEIYVVVVDEDD